MSTEISELDKETKKSYIREWEVGSQKLFNAIDKENFNLVKLLVNKYKFADPDCEGTSVIKAAKTGNVDIFEYLLTHRDYDHNPPELFEYPGRDIIRAAVENNDINIIHSLFKHKDFSKKYIDKDVYLKASADIKALLYPITQTYECSCGPGCSCKSRDSCWECWRYLGEDENTHTCVKCIAKAKHDQVK